MKSPANPKSARSSPGKKLAGPHVCSQVGKNLSNLLHVAMVEMCDKRGGKLSKAEIDHVFDLVMESSLLFSVFQRAYSNCIDLKNHSQLVEVDEKTVMHFVVNAFCRDVVARVFRAQINAKGSQWTYAFIDGFMTFLTNYVEPELSHELFRAYQKLALSFGGSLTPITILNSQDVVKVCNKTFVRMQASLDDGQLLKCLKLTVNEGIARSPNLNGPLKGELNDISILAFAKRVIVPSDSNPFRSIVLNG